MIDFFAAVAAAFAVGGVAMALGHLSGRFLRLPPPGWLVPVAAGAGMLGYAVWADYSWHQRVLLPLPADTLLVSQDISSDWWRPWTYAFPIVSGVTVAFPSEVVPHDTVPGVRFLNLHAFGRWAPQQVATVALDCDGGRGLELRPGEDFPVRAEIPEDAWRALPAGDPVLSTICPGS